MDGVTFKWLNGQECCEWLNEVMARKGWAELNPQTARALVAYKDERIVGFIVIQLFPHAEPLYVDPEFRGTGLADELADRMYEFLKEVRTRGYMVVAESPFAEKLCEARGMKRVNYPVYLAVQEQH